MKTELNKKQLGIYLAFAFGLAWAVGLIIYLTGGLKDSPQLVPGLSLAVILLALGYMWAPALAHIFTRLVTGQGWSDLLLRMEFKKCWKYILAAWFLPGVFTIIGAVVFFLIFPANYDPNLGVLQEILKAKTPNMNVSPWMIILANTIQAFLIAPIINSFFTFGEEFGWRGYLLPNLLPLGERKAFLISGIIWGLWHAPIIAMGHNYGLTYPGFPWTGILTMTWFCILAGTFIGWLSLKAKNIWPAVIGHAAINGIAGLATYFVKGTPNPIIGPLPVGLLGSAGFLAAAVWIYFQTRPVTE